MALLSSNACKVSFILRGSSSDLPMLYSFYSELFMPRQLLTGIFHESISAFQYNEEIRNVDRAEKWSYVELISKIAAHNLADKEQLGDYINLADSLSIRPRIYPARPDWESDLIHESLFSDLLVIPHDVFHDLIQYRFEQWNRLSRMAVAPIIIAPREQRTLENIIFVYDGTVQSARAIKNFSMLFSMMKTKKSTYIISTSDNSQSRRYDEEEALMNYARFHLPGVAYMRMDKAGIFEIIDFAAKIENHILVMGYDGVRNPAQTETLFSLSESLDNILFVSH